jgi:hypothetical protein
MVKDYFFDQFKLKNYLYTIIFLNLKEFWHVEGFFYKIY